MTGRHWAPLALAAVLGLAGSVGAAWTAAPASWLDVSPVAAALGLALLAAMASAWAALRASPALAQAAWFLPVLAGFGALEPPVGLPPTLLLSASIGALVAAGELAADAARHRNVGARLPGTILLSTGLAAGASLVLVFAHRLVVGLLGARVALSVEGRLLPTSAVWLAIPLLAAWALLLWNPRGEAPPPKRTRFSGSEPA